MEENILNLYGIYDSVFYPMDPEEAERARNDQLILYLAGIGTCLSWTLKRFFCKKNPIIIPKKLLNDTECVITYVEIKQNEQYYQCGLCEQIYLSNALVEWFEKTKNSICPYCQTESIDINQIYTNK